MAEGNSDRSLPACPEDPDGRRFFKVTAHYDEGEIQSIV